MKEGIIKVNSKRGILFDFTSFKYAQGSYLWLKDNYIMISFIETVRKGNGDFTRLIKRIHKAGFGVKVPTPLPGMLEIVKKKGFKKTMEFDENFDGDIEVGVLDKVNS
jgi:hypothetical protein